MPSIDDAARPPAALSASMPAARSISNCTPPPTASPAGRMSVTALPAMPAQMTANQLLVLKKSRCKANAQPKLADSASKCTDHPDGAEGGQTGPGPEHLGQARQDKVKGEPGGADDQRPPDEALDAERLRGPPAAPGPRGLSVRSRRQAFVRQEDLPDRDADALAPASLAQLW